MSQSHHGLVVQLDEATEREFSGDAFESPARQDLYRHVTECFLKKRKILYGGSR